MRDKRKRQVLQIVRRAVALALAIIGVWALSLTAELPALSGSLRRLGENGSLLLGFLADQLGVDAPDELQIAGVGRLLVNQSALLSAAADAVFARQSAAQEEPNALEEEVHGSQPEFPATTQGSDVVVHTAVGQDDGSYLKTEDVYIKNSAGLEVDVAALAAAQVGLGLGEGPQILIIHTHGSEAYTMDGSDRYVESDPYRTTDCNQNIVRVGDGMAEVFRQAGFGVLHDTNLYDYPVYEDSYDRSRAALKRWLEQYPTIKVVLDVHRDALVSKEGAPYKFITEYEGEQVAQVMLVMGSNDGGAEHPNWRDNLALAVQLQMRLAQKYQNLARPITLRSSRFNQDLSSGSLLVEVGGHGNTLQEAIAGGKLFAREMAELLQAMGT